MDASLVAGMAYAVTVTQLRSAGAPESVAVRAAVCMAYATALALATGGAR